MGEIDVAGACLDVEGADEAGDADVVEVGGEVGGATMCQSTAQESQWEQL